MTEWWAAPPMIHLQKTDQSQKHSETPQNVYVTFVLTLQ